MIDPLILARIQFAFTIAYHIIFPALSIGLASFLVVLEWRWLRTKDIIYKELYLFWVKFFAISFGIGVVTGIVMSYQFGTNWAGFSTKAGNIIGPLMGYEVLTAFFLESSFLGIMLFGWKRVSNKMHFIATLIVAIGTVISAFWILSVNSWMQTPTGYSIDANGIFHPESWMEIIFNPSFLYRLSHMLIATYLATAFFVGGVAAYYLLSKRNIRHAKIMLYMTLLMAVFISPIQAYVGDLHGINTLKHQPLKVAAMEGIWENEKGAGLRLFALPDEENERNKYEITIPKLSSIILTHSLDGEILGLKNWPKEDRPPVTIVFFAFRIMVGIGLLMILTGVIGLILYLKKQLLTSRKFFVWLLIMSPSGLIALLAGWFVTEVGRQPYMIYNLLRVADASSESIASGQLIWSLITFVTIYTLILMSAIFYIRKLIKNGITSKESDDLYGSHGLKEPFNISHKINEH